MCCPRLPGRGGIFFKVLISPMHLLPKLLICLLLGKPCPRFLWLVHMPLNAFNKCYLGGYFSLEKSPWSRWHKGKSLASPSGSHQIGQAHKFNSLGTRFALFPLPPAQNMVRNGLSSCPLTSWGLRDGRQVKLYATKFSYPNSVTSFSIKHFVFYLIRFQSSEKVDSDTFWEPNHCSSRRTEIWNSLLCPSFFWLHSMWDLRGLNLRPCIEVQCPVADCRGKSYSAIFSAITH